MDTSRRTDWLACWIAACAFLAHVCAAQTAEETSPPPPSLEIKRISAEEFGALPFMGDPKLSPDGTRIAARAYTPEGLKLVVIALAGATQPSRALPIPEKRDLLWHRWAGNDRLLLSLGKSERLMGEDYYVTRLMMIDLAAERAEFIGKRTEGIEGDDVLYVDPEGKWLLLNIQETVYDYPSVWRVDLDTIKMKRVVAPRDYVWNWYADNRGVVRVGIGSLGKRWWVLYRSDDKKSFDKVASGKETSAEEGDIDTIHPLSDSDKGYAVANTRTGRFALYHYDFATDTLGDAVFEHPTVDIDAISFNDDGTIRAVYYTDDRRRIEWFDPEMKALQADIDEALPNRLNRIVTTSRDKKRMVVWTGAASDPGRLYLFQPEAGAMRLLAKPYEKIDASALADMQSTSYTARDGLRIPAYLTMPRGVGDKNLPLVIMPHGGPFARDEWMYHSWVQFLANRGYVVLQPNFRGSTGYGKEFVQKGEGHWGRGMQDDIDDGVKWLVEQGTVDPKRVCIMGGSFGGYAAMWAAARNPEIYRCAISYAGISDVAAMLKYDRRLMRATRYYRNWRESVQGDKTFDLASVSPLHHVDRISIPILIAHGSRDERVPASQSRQLHEALKKLNKPHEFVIYEGEGHGFEDPDNHVDFLKRVEAFLEKHNPAAITEGG